MNVWSGRKCPGCGKHDDFANPNTPDAMCAKCHAPGGQVDRETVAREDDALRQILGRIERGFKSSCDCGADYFPQVDHPDFDHTNVDWLACPECVAETLEWRAEQDARSAR